MVPAGPRPTAGIGPLWHTRSMTTSSDLAVLSSVVAQIDELGKRVTDLAEQYAETPDSAIAAELYATERALASARRSLDRVVSLLGALGD